MKSNQSSQLSIAKDDRKFKKPSSISKMLKCSICYEVFHEPTRLFCGHTFCFDCLQSCIKSGSNCPMCRLPINKKDVGKDLLAYNLINECEVFCIHEDCSWQGTLDMLSLHVFYECLYQELAGNRRKNKPPKAVLDEQVEQKINENVVRGNLISRVLMKDNSMKTGRSFDVARQIISSDSQSNFGRKAAAGAGKKSAEGVEQAKQPPKKDLTATNDIDFLMQLYENSK